MNTSTRLRYFKYWFLHLFTFLLLVSSINANALVLQRGTETHLTGSLGDVQVNYVDDFVNLSGYLSSSGLVMNLPQSDWVATRRIQYDVLNNVANDSIFSLRINYDSSVTVLGALDPHGFFDESGQGYGFGGIAYTTLFDNGYGTYDYNHTGYGSEWTIEYAADHVTWNNIGNGFLAGTATGFTEFGFHPTFALYFAPDTEFGLLDATTNGVNSVSSGQVLSGIRGTVVPEPGTLSLLGLGLLAAAGIRKRKHHA